MKTRSTFAKLALSVVAASAALSAIPAAASAQSYYENRAYDSRGGYYYDGCERSQNNRAVAGGLAGAVAGAVIGGNVASRNARDEGAILGGVLGAVAGSQIGKKTAACERDRADQGYYDNRYDNRYDTRYDDRYDRPYGQTYNGPGYDPRPYDYDRDNRDYSYGYGNTDRSYSADCRMVESTIRMPDGRREKRMVQACRDSNGEYRIVD